MSAEKVHLTFSIWIQPQQAMWNMCLLVCIGYKAVATRDILFKCSAEPLIEVVIIGFLCFICQIEMEWKPHPLCPVIEINSGFALEIPLNHKIQICLATEKDKITVLWTLYLLEVIMIKCFPFLSWLKAKIKVRKRFYSNLIMCAVKEKQDE